jgi:cystathionine gamma-synthase
VSEPRSRHGDATRAVHGPADGHGPVSTPIVHSATFSFPDLEAMNDAQARGAAGAFYQRYGHPTLRGCEERLADLGGAAEALLFSSGSAAMAAVLLSRLRTGDRVVALEQSYGGTLALLEWGRERFGWDVALVDARAPESFAAGVTPGTSLFHVESPTNPSVQVVDVAAAATLAHAAGALLSVDNTFASPIGQPVHALGADLAVYSATKSIGGHADLLAGAVTGAKDVMEPVYRARRTFGPVPDPQLAWQIERSLKTLPLRVAASNANALELARRLAGHPALERVFYPGLTDDPGHAIAARQMRHGFGPVVAIAVRGGAAAAERVVNAFELIRHAASLGGVDSLASLPAFTSHVHLGAERRRRAGIPEGAIRLSFGIEDAADLWRDLEQALGRVASVKASS